MLQEKRIASSQPKDATETNSLLEKRNWKYDPEYQFETSTHHGKKVIFIRFPYNEILIKNVKEIKARWSFGKTAWYVPDTPHFRGLFNIPAKIAGAGLMHQAHPTNQVAFRRFQETLTLKGYSPSTHKTYSTEFAQFLCALGDVAAEQLPYERLRAYILHCITDQHLSEAQIHSRINAIKFYCEQVLNRQQFLMELPRPKKPFKLPRVLSAEDISAMLTHTENKKHQLMLQLVYGMGLRVSEIIKMRITDIDTNRMQVLIAAAKGKKDRYTNLPTSVLSHLSHYLELYKPSSWLIEGQYGGQYSIRSAQAVFKAALKKAGIKKNVGIHSLRHSYATHLLEMGTDISYIKELLGHNNIKTTLIYTHVGHKQLSRVESPLDKLDL